MILAGTSAWVEHDRATGSDVDRRMVELIRDEGPLAVTEPVVMEVAAGARTDEREIQLRRLPLSFELLRLDGAVDLDAATLVHRRCRQAGVTPRGLLHCLIATVALRHEATLLAADADLLRVARVTGLGLDRSSPGR